MASTEPESARPAIDRSGQTAGLGSQCPGSGGISGRDGALQSRYPLDYRSLGNAFLAQQADVMDAIQRLRVRASDNGRLTNTPQQIVTTETQNQQSAIRIQPANPQVLYPPIYNPSYVWGPPASGAYPALPYPQDQYGSGYASGYGSGSGYGFGNGINLLGLFSGLISGFGGWGWALNWFTHALSLAGSFFSNFGFNNYSGGFNSGGGYGAPAIWAHNPAHRLGVPYPHGFSSGQNRRSNFDARLSSSRLSESRFAQSGLPASGRSASAGHSASDAWRTFGNSARTSTPSASAVGRGFQSGNNQRAESYNRPAGPASRSGYARRTWARLHRTAAAIRLEGPSRWPRISATRLNSRELHRRSRASPRRRRHPKNFSIACPGRALFPAAQLLLACLRRAFLRASWIFPRLRSAPFGRGRALEQRIGQGLGQRLTQALTFAL